MEQIRNKNYGPGDLATNKPWFQAGGRETSLQVFDLRTQSTQAIAHSEEVQLVERFFVAVGVTLLLPLFYCFYFVVAHDYPFMAAAYLFALTTSSLLFWFLLFYLVSKRALLSSIAAAAVYSPINYYLSVEASRKSNLTLREGGVDYFIKGEITQAGIYDKIQNYMIVFLILFLASFIVSRFVKRFTDAN